MVTVPDKCACGNRIFDDRCGSCEWCLDIDAAKAAQTAPHSWQHGRFTGTVTCSICGLMPVDPVDSYSDCPGHR